MLQPQLVAFHVQFTFSFCWIYLVRDTSKYVLHAEVNVSENDILLLQVQIVHLVISLQTLGSLRE
jgi:hypothetical protein